MFFITISLVATESFLKSSNPSAPQSQKSAHHFDYDSDDDDDASYSQSVRETPLSPPPSRNDNGNDVEDYENELEDLVLPQTMENEPQPKQTATPKAPMLLPPQTRSQYRAELAINQLQKENVLLTRAHLSLQKTSDQLKVQNKQLIEKNKQFIEKNKQLQEQNNRCQERNKQLQQLNIELFTKNINMEKKCSKKNTSCCWSTQSSDSE